MTLENEIFVYLDKELKAKIRIAFKKGHSERAAIFVHIIVSTLSTYGKSIEFYA